MGYKTTYYTTRNIAIQQIICNIQMMDDEQLSDLLDDQVDDTTADFKIVDEDELHQYEDYRVVKKFSDMDKFFGL